MADIRAFLYSITRTLARDIEAETSQAMAAALDDYVKSVGAAKSAVAAKLTELNTESAYIAQDAMVTSYENRTINRFIPSYRIGDRFSGGALYRALNDEENIRHTTQSWGLLKRSFMDQQAPQWYRMSFGAGNVTASNRVDPIYNPLNKRKIARTGILAEFQPSRAFALPESASYRWRVKGVLGGIGEIHVTPSDKGRPRLENLSIEPSRFVQDGISAGNKFYAEGLAELALESLTPGQKNKVISQLKRNRR